MKVTLLDLQNAWNANRGELPSCNGLAGRERNANALLGEIGEDLSRLVEAIKRVARSPFCTGAVPTKDSPAGFKATFDWFIKPGVLLHVEEGQFDGAREIVPPDTPSPADLTYWQTPKPPRWNPTQEQFDRTQIAGRLSLAKERATKKQDHIGDDIIRWIDKGGSHPWATDTQIEAAWAEVQFCRLGAMENKDGKLVHDPNNKLPSTIDQALGRILQ